MIGWSAKCNYCGTIQFSEDCKHYGPVPDGWILISTAHCIEQVDDKVKSYHFCSTKCATAFLDTNRVKLEKE